MHRFPAVILVAALALLGLPALASATPPDPSPASAGGGADYVDPDLTDAVTLRLRGRLLVADGDGQGADQYAVRLSTGATVPVTGDLDAAPANASVVADVAVPHRVLDDLGDVADGADLSARSATGRRALRLITASRAEPAVASASWVAHTDAPATATPSVTHHVYVAMPTGLGDLAVSDPEALAQLREVADYWTEQSNGRIAGYDIATSVVRYTPTVATSDNKCGLDSDFFEVTDEAAAQFSSAHFGSGSADQLVVLAPEQCTSTSAAGRARVNNGLSDGGPSVVTLGDYAFSRGVVAHEWGHNYGLMHSNTGLCTNGFCNGEYDNVYNVMGRGLSHEESITTALSTAYRTILGITDPGEVLGVAASTASTPTSRTLMITERNAGTGARAAKVVDPDSGQSFLVEYRSGHGRDAGSAYAGHHQYAGMEFQPGIVMEGIDGRSATLVSDDSYDVDEFGIGHPQASFLAGQTWHNDSRTLTVRVDAIDGTTATITVTQTPGPAFTTTPTWKVGGDNVAYGQVFAEQDGDYDPYAAVSYQWLADGVAVPDGSGSSYFPVPEDIGKRLSVRITAYSHGVRPSVQTVQAAASVVPGTLQVSVPPSASGSGTVGQTLQGVDGYYVAAYGAAPSLAHTWARDGVTIPNATGSSYTITDADRGHTLTYVETAHLAGYTDLVTPSAGVQVASGWQSPTPTITGTAQVGKKLTATTGTWTGGAVLSYRWLRDGAPITGATTSSYVATAADRTHRLSVTVTGTRGSNETSRTSAETSAVAYGVLTAPKPTISGTAKVGKVLTARPGTWTSGTTLSYAWFANGVAVSGTRSTLTLTSAQRGKRMTVRVTGAKDGYTTRSATSSATAAVAR